MSYLLFCVNVPETGASEEENLEAALMTAIEGMGDVDVSDVTTLQGTPPAEAVHLA